MKDKQEIIQVFRRSQDLSSAISSCRLVGLMMIGEVEASERDFSRMIQLKKELATDAGWTDCKLSMGMSGDYELAVKMGSDVVRIGSAIFGERMIK